VDDAGLIARSVVDGRWFEVLFDRHHRRIHRFCVARGGLDAADDLAAETFVTAFRRRAEYDLAFPDAAPWLFGIALNVVRASRRRELAQRRVVQRVAALEPGELWSEAFEGDGALGEALRGLSAQDRDLIVLFAWAGLSYEQLAECFGVPVGTVRSRLSRIRGRLRSGLASASPVGEQEVAG
jgi:RNA polymerase sigma-70 factor (ECF subfamily)